MGDKESPFTYVETHAGAGSYDLLEGAAAKLNEQADGIELLLNFADRAGGLDALPVHAPSSPDPIPSRLAYFPPQIGYENKVMVELGERMLLVAILGTVSVLGAVRLRHRRVPHAARFGLQADRLRRRAHHAAARASHQVRACLQALRHCGGPALHTAHARHTPPPPFGPWLITE